jgi:hypothetical protein
MPADPPYFLVREIQARLRMQKPDVIFRAIRNGELIALNVSGGAGRASWRIPAAALDSWLASRRSGPPPVSGRRPRRVRLAGVTEFF